MQVQNVSQISFGYNHPLKTLYKKGKIPLTQDFYGAPLNKKNVTIEHLNCVCNGGKTELGNIVLATADKNLERGNKPLIEAIDFKAMGEYFEFFKDKVFGPINGNEYIQQCMKTITKLLQNGK